MKSKPAKYVFRYSILLTVVIAGCNADQYTKSWARSSLKDNPALSYLGGNIELGYAENRGMVFGLLNTGTFAPVHTVLRHLSLLGALFLVAYVLVERKKPLSHLLPLYVMLAGALGNALDKLRFGFVVDFIHMQLGPALNWPFLFNIADVLLCTGIGLVILRIALDRKPAGSRS